MFHHTDELGFFLLFSNIFKNILPDPETTFMVVTKFYKIYKLKQFPELAIKAHIDMMKSGNPYEYTFRFGEDLYARFLHEYNKKEVIEIFRLWYFEYGIGVTEEIADGYHWSRDIKRDLRVVPSSYIDLTKPNDLYSLPWYREESKYVLKFIPKPVPPPIDIPGIWP